MEKIYMVWHQQRLISAHLTAEEAERVIDVLTHGKHDDSAVIQVIDGPVMKPTASALIPR